MPTVEGEVGIVFFHVLVSPLALAISRSPNRLTWAPIVADLDGPSVDLPHRLLR